MEKHLEAFEKYLRDRPTGISPLTIETYLTAVVKFQQWFEAESDESFLVHHITPVDVRDYLEWMQTGAQHKPATINKNLAGLRSFFTWAIDQGFLKKSQHPVLVQNLSGQRQAPRSLHIRKEYRPLRRAAENYGSKRDVAIVKLLRHAGLRVSELCALKLTDIDISARKGRVVVRSGKGRRYREIGLNKPARLAIKDYLAVRPENKGEFLFLGQRGPLTRKGVSQLIDKYQRLAGLEGITPHKLRHTFGKSLLDSGADLVLVADLMGHSRIDSTARYTRSSERDREVALDRMAYEE